MVHFAETSTEEDLTALRSTIAMLENDGERLDWLECLLWDTTRGGDCTITAEQVCACLVREYRVHGDLRRTIDSIRSDTHSSDRAPQMDSL